MKQKRKIAHSQTAAENVNLLWVPEKYQDAAYILLISLLLIVFFSEPLFKNKVFLAPDNLASKSFNTYLGDGRKQGVFPQWIPYIFSGMPSYASLMITGNRWFDFTTTLWKYFQRALHFVFPNTEVFSIVFYYFVFGVSMYIFIRWKLGNRFVAFFVSTAVLYSSFVIIWIMIGHNTKIASVMFLPLIFLVIEKNSERLRVIYAILLVILIHFLFESTHVQMIYYAFMAFGLYYVYQFIARLLRREPVRGLAQSFGVFVVASMVAFAMSSDRYLSTIEYNKYSIRGSAPILASTSSQKASPGSGLDYQYATNWSFSPGEVITFFIPSYYGFGWHEYKGPLTNNQPYRLNTYWGQMPFTDAPQYMGIIPLVLAIVGVMYFRKNPWVQFLVILSILALFVSFGKNLPILYDLMFYYLPFFNKFRVPSMILVLLQIALPILAGFGIYALYSMRREKLTPNVNKTFLYTITALAVFFVLTFLLKSTIQGWYVSQLQGSEKQIAVALRPFLFETMITDLRISLFIALCTLGFSWAYLLGKTKTLLLNLAFISILLFDLWRVDKKPFDVQPKRQQDAQFEAPAAVQFIRSDSSLYRVFQLRDNTPLTDNSLAYFGLQNIYGYHAAKLRFYQDVIDVVDIRNPWLWNLLNMKYLISDRAYTDARFELVHDGQQKVLLNKGYLPRAFFVSRYDVAEPLDVLNKMKNGEFDPKEIAYLESDPHLQIDPPGKEASVSFTSYGIHYITLKAHATGNNLLFLSEVFYPPGWKAYVDDQETPIYKTNYAFRSIVVPPGTHRVKFTYKSKSFEIGKIITLTSNSIVLLGLALFAFQYARRTSADKPTGERAKQSIMM